MSSAAGFPEIPEDQKSKINGGVRDRFTSQLWVWLLYEGWSSIHITLDLSPPPPSPSLQPLDRLTLVISVVLPERPLLTVSSVTKNYTASGL